MKLGRLMELTRRMRLTIEKFRAVSPVGLESIGSLGSP
jgi:hypothetical protein